MFLFFFSFSLQLPLIFTLLLGPRVELIGINGGELNSRNLFSCWSGLPEKIIIKSKMGKKRPLFFSWRWVGLGLGCLSSPFLADAFG